MKNFTTLLLLTIIYLKSFSQLYTDSSVVYKSYPVDPFSSVEIINKYGNIEVVNHNEDSLKLEISIIINTEDTLKLENIQENIDFAYTESSKSIQIKTLFKPQRNGFFPNIKDYNVLNENESEIQVNYRVFLPEFANLSLQNKYGNIKLANIMGEVKILLSNGNLNCSKLNENIFIDLKFGNGKISELNTGTINLQYVTNFEIIKAQNAKINSRSSYILLDQIHSLKLQSKRDDILVKKANFFYSELFLSNLKLEDIKKSIHINSKHSTIHLKLNKEIEKTQIISSNDKIECIFPKNLNQTIEVENNEYEIYFSKNFRLEQLNDTLVSKSFLYKGYLNKKTENALKIVAESSEIVLLNE